MDIKVLVLRDKYLMSEVMIQKGKTCSKNGQLFDCKWFMVRLDKTLPLD